MSAIIKRELSSYFNSAIGYIVLAVFYFFSGLFFYLYCLLSNTASMNYLFLSMLMIVMLIIPVITMRSFSEEKKQKRQRPQSMGHKQLDIYSFFKKMCFAKWKSFIKFL